MKIAIIGTGGVGGYFGGKLALAGFDVMFLARGKHLEAIRSKGLIVKSILGDFCIENANATDRIENIGEVDLIIIGLKAWQLKEVRDELPAIIHSRTTVLPLQNGVLAADELCETIDKRHIIGGLCRIISLIESPGVIAHVGVTPSIVLGELDKSELERTLAVKSVLEQAGIEVKLSKDIEADLWKKFIAICVSGLLAVSRTTYGEMRELKETREMMVALLTEIYEVSLKAGVDIKPGFVDKAVAFIDTFPPDSTSSLTRDVWEGKPSEIEYQNGTVVRLGKKLGVPTPINEFIYNCILAQEIKART